MDGQVKEIYIYMLTRNNFPMRAGGRKNIYMAKLGLLALLTQNE